VLDQTSEHAVLLPGTHSGAGQNTAAHGQTLLQSHSRELIPNPNRSTRRLVKSEKDNTPVTSIQGEDSPAHAMARSRGEDPTTGRNSRPPDASSPGFSPERDPCTLPNVRDQVTGAERRDWWDSTATDSFLWLRARDDSDTGHLARYGVVFRRSRKVCAHTL
jgi:hypothetical protein